MKDFFKQLGIIVILLGLSFVFSFYSAHFFGSWYYRFSPVQMEGTWIGSRGSWQFIMGFPFAWIFFVGLLFWTFVPKHYKGWIAWLMAPSFLFFGGGDLPHFYLPVALALLAWGIALLIRKIFGIIPPSPAPRRG